MKISKANSSEAIDSIVYIYEKQQELKPIGLSKDELSYLEDATKGKANHIVRLNHYPRFIHLVKVSDSKESSGKTKEEQRHLGNKLLRMIKAEKHDTIRVEPLSKRISSYYLVEGMALGAYQFLKYFSDADTKKNKLENIEVTDLDEKQIRQLNAVISAVYFARNIVNEPVSFLTATQLAAEATKVGAKTGFKVEVLTKKKIEALKMGGLLAVNKGSVEPPTFTIMTYKPQNAVNKKPVVLVGKGVVYDTGGLSLKPTPNSMDSMKSDMGGAAAVIGTMMAVAESELPVWVIGLVPSTDNRPGGDAYAPGDVIHMYDGSTVEVLNTDAEGRMILADALAYAKKLKPELVVDLATLTGAAAIAIGKYGIVAMGTADDNVKHKLEDSGREVYERLAFFPFWDEYNELLRSSIADVKNIGGREAGAITAGKFLERFTDYPWIHLDIAGSAFLDADHEYRLKGGTGVGIRLLFDYLKKLS